MADLKVAQRVVVDRSGSPIRTGSGGVLTTSDVPATQSGFPRIPGDANDIPASAPKPPPVPTRPIAEALPGVARFAGSVSAEGIQELIAKGKFPGVSKDAVVEGPSAFSRAAVTSPPTELGHLKDEVGVWTTFQMAPTQAERLNPFDKSNPFPYVTAQQIRDLIPKLKPGDMIMNGINGATGHMSIYLGPDPKTGVPMVLHAMATDQTHQSYAQVLWNAIKLPFSGPGPHVGVITEPLVGFFERFPRDTFAAIRDPQMTDAMRDKGLAHIKTLLGMGYNADLSLGEKNKFYCSEVGLEMMKAAYEGSGKSTPHVGTTWEPLVKQLVATPENFLASPSFELIDANDTGKKFYADNKANTVIGQDGAPAPSDAEARAFIAEHLATP